MDKQEVQFLWEPPDGERIVGIIQYQDYVIIATDRGIWRTRTIDEFRITPIPFNNSTEEGGSR